MPGWLLGTWDVADVHESDAGPVYQTGSDPKHSYTGKSMTISQSGISFGEHVCDNPMATTKLGTVANIVRKARRSTIDHTGEYGLPHDTRRLRYLEVHCGRILADLGDGTAAQPTRQTMSWYVVMRSHDRIEMPFYAASYVDFKRPEPTS